MNRMNSDQESNESVEVHVHGTFEYIIGNDDVDESVPNVHIDIPSEILSSSESSAEPCQSDNYSSLQHKLSICRDSQEFIDSQDGQKRWKNSELVMMFEHRGELENVSENEFVAAFCTIKNREFEYESITSPEQNSTDSNESEKKSVYSDKSSNVGKDTVSASNPLFSFSSGFSLHQPASSSSFTSSSSIVTLPPSPQSKTDGNKSSEFVTQLKKLNDRVLSVIKVHIDSDKACILTPIFADYEKYVKELKDKHTNLPAKINHANSTAVAATFSFSHPTLMTDSLSPGQSSTTAVSFASSPTLFSFCKSSNQPLVKRLLVSPANKEKETEEGPNKNTEKAEDDPRQSSQE